MPYFTIVLASLFSLSAFAFSEIATEEATSKIVTSISQFQSFNQNGYNFLEGTLVGDSSQKCIVRYRIMKRSNGPVDGFTMDIFPSPSDGVQVSWMIMNSPIWFEQTKLHADEPLYISTLFKGFEPTDTPTTLEVYVDYASKMIGINNITNDYSVGLGCEALTPRL